MFAHVHCEALDAPAQRVEGSVALIALNLSPTTLATDTALQVPAVSRDFVHSLYWLHEVGVLHPQLRDPLHGTVEGQLGRCRDGITGMIYTGKLDHGPCAATHAGDTVRDRGNAGPHAMQHALLHTSWDCYIVASWQTHLHAS